MHCSCWTTHIWACRHTGWSPGSPAESIGARTLAFNPCCTWVVTWACCSPIIRALKSDRQHLVKTLCGFIWGQHYIVYVENVHWAVSKLVAALSFTWVEIVEVRLSSTQLAATETSLSFVSEVHDFFVLLCMLAHAVGGIKGLHQLLPSGNRV